MKTSSLQKLLLCSALFWTLPLSASPQDPQQTKPGEAGVHSGGGGGSELAMDFVQTGRLAWAKAQHPEIDRIALAIAIETTSVLFTREELTLLHEDSQNGRREAVAAINFPSEKKILVNELRWKALSQRDRTTLALHEYLGIASGGTTLDRGYRISLIAIVDNFGRPTTARWVLDRASEISKERCEALAKPIRERWTARLNDMIKRRADYADITYSITPTIQRANDVACVLELSVRSLLVQITEVQNQEIKQTAYLLDWRLQGDPTLATSASLRDRARSQAIFIHPYWVSNPNQKEESP
jgi:hypothetical protein